MHILISLSLSPYLSLTLTLHNPTPFLSLRWYQTTTIYKCTYLPTTHTYTHTYIHMS